MTTGTASSDGGLAGQKVSPTHSCLRILPTLLMFSFVLIAHALYVRHTTIIALSAPVADGWADSAADTGGAGLWGMGPYLAAGDYWLGLSYGIGAAFAAWALGQFRRTRQAAMAAGAAGSVTLVGVLMAAGCFLVGCCGSPMLGVYAALFGAKALGVGKPFQFAITLVSVGIGWWCLSRRRTACSSCGSCAGGSC